MKLIFQLKSEASRTYLGYLWWVLEPLLYVAVLYVVFGYLLERRGENFIVFLLCGSIPFLWFSKTVSNASLSILGGQGLISQVAIPKFFFPLLVVAMDLLKQMFVFVTFFVFLLWYGVDTLTNWGWLLPVIVTQIMLIFACSLLIAGIAPFVPDVRYIIPSSMTLLMFSSGVFYSYKDVLSSQNQDWFLMNPVANLLNNYRLVLIDGVRPDLVDLAIIALVSILIVLLCMGAYRKADHIFTRLVIQ